MDVGAEASSARPVWGLWVGPRGGLENPTRALCAWAPHSLGTDAHLVSGFGNARGVTLRVQSPET